MEWKEIILKDNDKVNFIERTDKYGRAEFCICPVVKRGKLNEIFIYPMQQENASSYYRIPIDYEPYSWQVYSWTHKGLGEPKIWLMYWCKEHKCQGFRMYVPTGSNCFEISLLSTASIRFDGTSSEFD